MIDRACAVQGAHEISEGTHWNQVCSWDWQKHIIGEASSVSTGGGVRLQVNK